MMMMTMTMMTLVMMVAMVMMVMMTTMGLLSKEASSTTLPASSHHTITVWDLERRKENDDGDDDFAKLEV